MGGEIPQEITHTVKASAFGKLHFQKTFKKQPARNHRNMTLTCQLKHQKLNVTKHKSTPKSELPIPLSQITSYKFKSLQQFWQTNLRDLHLKTAILYHPLTFEHKRILN